MKIFRNLNYAFLSGVILAGCGGGASDSSIGSATTSKIVSG